MRPERTGRKLAQPESAFQECQRPQQHRCGHKTQGVETEEQGHPAQMTDDRFLVFEHPGQDVVLVGFRVVITDEEDRAVGEGTAHQGDGDVLVMGVQGCLSRVGLRDEGV